MEEYEQVPRPLVQDPIQVSPVVTPQFSELAVDMGAVRERERRIVVGDSVQQADLEVDFLLPLRRQAVHEVVDRLPAVRVPVVHGLHGVRGTRSGRDRAERTSGSPDEATERREKGAGCAPRHRQMPPGGGSFRNVR
jgi:hypothetical protein